MFSMLYLQMLNGHGDFLKLELLYPFEPHRFLMVSPLKWIGFGCAVPLLEEANKWIDMTGSKQFPQKMPPLLIEAEETHL